MAVVMLGWSAVSSVQRGEMERSNLDLRWADGTSGREAQGAEGGVDGLGRRCEATGVTGFQGTTAV